MGRSSGWLLLRRFFAVAFVIPLLGFASGGLAVLATHDDPTQFHGCVNNRTGFMRIVEDPARCITRQYSGVSLEREITWNQSGPRGFDGAQGPNGVPGEAGAPGAPGQAGDVGPQGPAGQNGVDGVN
ncbi:MAG: collagen-like protein, partial [Chloroflexia bacterium]|nr:collagen-like protein [Chloroflexia bacterium]